MLVSSFNMRRLTEPMGNVCSSPTCPWVRVQPFPWPVVSLPWLPKGFLEGTTTLVTHGFPVAVMCVRTGVALLGQAWSLVVPS